MIHQRALDLHRADAVPGHVQHVVHATEQPEVAVGIALRAVAGEVHVRRPTCSSTAARSARVAVDAAQHRGPRSRQRQQAAADLHLLALLACESRRRCPGTAASRDPGFVAVTPGSGVIMIAPVSVCHHVSTTGQRLAADVLVIPHPRLGIDRLADRSEQAERRQIVLLRATRCPSA